MDDNLSIYIFIFFLLLRRHAPSPTRTDTLFPYTTLCRSPAAWNAGAGTAGGRPASQHGADARLQMVARPVGRQARAVRGRRRPGARGAGRRPGRAADARSEEQTSALQSLMRISSAVFCLQTKIMHHNLQCSNRNSTLNSHT